MYSNNRAISSQKNSFILPITRIKIYTKTTTKMARHIPRLLNQFVADTIHGAFADTITFVCDAVEAFNLRIIKKLSLLYAIVTSALLLVWFFNDPVMPLFIISMVTGALAALGFAVVKSSLLSRISSTCAGRTIILILSLILPEIVSPQPAAAFTLRLKDIK